ncbi:MAG: UDP-N-acetylmuramate dehydrogenase [Deltaproteobacteria bacterium]|nr:UDP-N-acetylmuramate dehydrogenase [Deltaproteobacteria bacterium]
MQRLDIYLVGICGTGVGSLAGLLQQQGHRVRGSDEHVYPPMSDKLEEWGIEALEGYDAGHLEPAPDLVIIGNVIRATNPEAVAARERGLKTMSMPEAVGEFGIGAKHAIVIAGTHGKTTTTALLAHVLMEAGRDPSFLIGGAPVGFKESFRHGSGSLFVVEGDEYDTAYFDKGPKFLHYRPQIAVITSLEFDHADIYPTLAAVEAAFRALVGKVPADGRLVIWQGAERAWALALAHARTSRVTIYSTRATPDAHLYMKQFTSGPEGLVFEPVLRGRSLGEMRVALWGEFSAMNVLAAIGALEDCDLSAAQIRRGMETFKGVKRRLEIRGVHRGVAVVDDFGHHPTAVRETLAASRSRWPGRRLWAVFEPRSATTRRNVFQQELVAAFDQADEIVVASHERLTEIPVADRFDPAQLVVDLVARGRRARFVPTINDIVALIGREAADGDVVIIFSNGSFGGLHGKLEARLEVRA